MWGHWYFGSLPHQVIRGVTILVPHDTIRISIQRSPYNTYLDTYLSTERCQMVVMSSTKAETCDQEHRTYSATHVDGVPTTTTAAGWHKTWFCWVISEYLHQSGPKKYVFWLILLKNNCAYSFMWITIYWVPHIDTYRGDKISMHRDAPVNRYTPTGHQQVLIM